MTKIYTTRGSGLRARKQPSTDAAIVGMFPAGAALIVDHNETVGEDIWHALPVTAGGVALRDPSDLGAPAFLFAAHRYRGTDYTDAEVVEPPPPPPPTVPRLVPFGVNIQGDISAAYDAYAAGCRHFLFIDNFGAASEFMDRHPDATIHARRWGFRADGDVESMMRQLEGANDGRLVYEGPNEGDAGNEQNDPAGLAGRLRAEVRLARAIKAHSGARYAAGAFSNGNPTDMPSDPRVRAAVRTEFAPAYNAGDILLCLHLYSPTAAHVFDDEDLKWYERRYELWFGDDEEHCGLDPNVRNVVSSEGLIDQGSRGGALGCGLSEAQTEKVIRQTRIVHARPITATWKGVTKQFASPLVWWLIFCYGNSPSWKTYNHQQWTEMLRRLWAVST